MSCRQRIEEPRILGCHIYLFLSRFSVTRRLIVKVSIVVNVVDINLNKEIGTLGMTKIDLR